MAEPRGAAPQRRWFDRFLRGLPATVRYRLFSPAYEDLRQDQLLRLRAARWPGRRPILGLWFALRVLALIAACYRGSPEFVLIHPLRAFGAFCHALIASSRTMLIHDIRQAFRLLRKQPLFAALAIAILALSIGASTAIFSVVDAVLLRPLPFPDPDRLVSLDETADGHLTAVSPINFYDWQQQATSFEGMAIYQDQTMTLAQGDRAQTVVGFSV